MCYPGYGPLLSAPQPVALRQRIPGEYQGKTCRLERRNRTTRWLRPPTVRDKRAKRWDPWENQGIGCSVDEPGRPRVRLPPLRRRTCGGNHRRVARAIPRGSLKTQQCVKSQCFTTPSTGRAQRASARGARPQRRYLEHPDESRMSQQRHRVGPWCRPSSPSSLGEVGEPRRPRGWRVLMRAKSSPRPAPRDNARNLDDL